MPQAGSVALPKVLPLVIRPENRDTSPSKDARLINCYMEKGEEESEFFIYKRVGLLRDSRPPGANAAGCGLYNWLGDQYSIFGPSFYKNGVLVSTVDSTNGVYRFSSCLGATPKLQLGNGVKAYNYDAGSGLVQITDGDFPAAFVKGWAYLDGTTYVMTTKAAIQGSAINDPTSWDPLNVIIAQIEPDGGVALNKQLVYTVAFKQWTTEIFYDAGNATGSPLGPVQGAKVNWGCVSQDSVQEMDGSLFWVATNRSGAVNIMMMDNLKAEVISTPSVERLLDNADFTTVYSFTFKNKGHRFYVLTVKNTNLTLVYDTVSRSWHQWTDAAGNYFPFVAATYNAQLQHFFQHESNGRIYQAETNYLTDDGDIITCDIYTPNFTGGTSRGKLMTQMRFKADQTQGSVLQVRHSDNDYQSWSNFRNVDLSQKIPLLSNCGTFTKRAHNLRHACPTAFRIMAVEMQLDLCSL